MILRRLAMNALVSLMIVAPAVALVLIRLDAREDMRSLEPEVTEVFVDPALVEVDESRPVVLRVTWAPPETVFAPQWTGTVTAVPDADGNLVTGDPVIEVDGVTRVAVASERPFTKPLGPGDSGDDVAMLQKVLTEIGAYDAAIDGTFGSSTLEAVRHLATRISVSPTTRTFDPLWTVWIPRSPFPFASIEAAIGRPAPSWGDVVAVGFNRIAGVEILSPEGESEALPGSWILSISDAEFVVVDGALSEASLQSLADYANPDAADIGAVARLQDPVPVTPVPPPAIQSSESGELCVWIGSPPRTYPVDVVSGGQGVAHVSGAIPAPILVNPHSVLSDPSCD